jgi:hypothetical protein
LQEKIQPITYFSNSVQNSECGEEPKPLIPEDHEKAIREIPREPEVIELFKNLVGGAGPLPPH